MAMQVSLRTHPLVLCLSIHQSNQAGEFRKFRFAEAVGIEMGGCKVQMLAASSSLRLAPMVMMVIASLLLLGAAEAAVDCATVRALVSTCSAFIAYGTPDPYPGTPCCDAMTTLNMVAEPLEDRRAVCSCLMGLINAYSPNATAIATLAGFCGVSLGFSISPNTDCNYI